MILIIIDIISISTILKYVHMYMYDVTLFVKKRQLTFHAFTFNCDVVRNKCNASKTVIMFSKTVRRNVSIIEKHVAWVVIRVNDICDYTQL